MKQPIEISAPELFSAGSRLAAEVQGVFLDMDNRLDRQLERLDELEGEIEALRSVLRNALLAADQHDLLDELN